MFAPVKWRDADGGFESGRRTVRQPGAAHRMSRCARRKHQAVLALLRGAVYDEMLQIIRSLRAPVRRKNVV
jgi:hypothetical protein